MNPHYFLQRLLASFALALFFGLVLLALWGVATLIQLSGCEFRRTVPQRVWLVDEHGNVVEDESRRADQ